MDVKWFANEVYAEVKKAEKKVLREIGKMVTRTAKELCPVGSQIQSSKRGVTYEREPGTLRRSIHWRLTRKGGVQIIAGSRKYMQTHGGKRYMGRDPYYARFVEFGTRYMLARPYLRPALARNHSNIMRAFNGALP